MSVCFTSLLPPLDMSFLAGVCLAAGVFGWGRLSGLRLTLSTCGRWEVMCLTMLLLSLGTSYKKYLKLNELVLSDSFKRTLND